VLSGSVYISELHTRVIVYTLLFIIFLYLQCFDDAFPFEFHSLHSDIWSFLVLLTMLLSTILEFQVFYSNIPAVILFIDIGIDINISWVLSHFDGLLETTANLEIPLPLDPSNVVSC